MSVGSSPGDLLLAARPLTPEAFAPYGKVLAPGARVLVGRGGPVHVSVEAARPGPRRVTHLVRYPEARRVVLPLGGVSLLLLVLGPGERPEGPPTALLGPPGSGVLLAAGVWHHGPVPLRDVPLAELLETTGPADRLDRRSLRELIDVEGVRIALPEEGDASSGTP